MAKKIYQADEEMPCELDGLRLGGQVIVLETPLDVVNHYREVLVAYHEWLQTNTDTFDPVMVQITMESGHELKFEKPYIEDLVLHHLCDEGLPVIVDDATPNLEWWIKNNREIEVLEGGDPDEAEERTRRAFAEHPENFTREAEWVVVNPDNTMTGGLAVAQGYTIKAE